MRFLFPVAVLDGAQPGKKTAGNKSEPKPEKKPRRIFLRVGSFFPGWGDFFSELFFQICFRVGGLGHVQGAVLGLSWAVLGVS